MANCSSSGEETGSQAGTASVWPLWVIATESTRLSWHQAEAGALSCRLQHGSHVSSNKERGATHPLLGLGIRSMAVCAPELCSAWDRAAPAPRWREQERCHGAVSPGNPPEVLRRTDPPSPCCHPLPQPLSFLIIGLLSSPTIAPGRTHPRRPCATGDPEDGMCFLSKI